MVLYAKDIVDRDFIALPRSTTVLEAAKIMKEKRHGFVVITTEDGRPEGIVTEWDLVSKIIAEEKNPNEVRLEDIMTKEVISVKANDGIDYVAKVMTDKMIRRLLVLENDKVLGFITSRTIVKNLNEYVDRVSAQIARLQAPPF
ncbi:MAG: CBS domain-containing protein [Conexivisphaerales archaeon]